MAEARLFGGVDGGATKTWALVGDEAGRLLGFGAGGPANYHVFGMELTMGSVSAALGAAAAAAGSETGALTRAACCLAGDDSAEDHASLGEALVRTLGVGGDRPGPGGHGGPAIQWDNDCWAALRGGTRKGWGAVVIGGSGTNSAAVSPDGKRAILRGLGRETGNPGGASDIARDAVFWGFRMDEGSCEKTALHGEILKVLGLPDYDAVVSQTSRPGLDPTAVAAFAYQAMGLITPLVFRLAAEGDPYAQRVLVDNGRLMGEQTAAVMRRAGIEGLEADVVLAGSVYRGRSPLLIDALTLAVHRVAPKARPRLPLYHPVVGAYLLALEGAGVPVGPGVYANVDETLPGLLPQPAAAPEQE